jgi:hypothetical protein
LARKSFVVTGKRTAQRNEGYWPDVVQPCVAKDDQPGKWVGFDGQNRLS